MGRLRGPGGRRADREGRQMGADVGRGNLGGRHVPRGPGGRGKGRGRGPRPESRGEDDNPLLRPDRGREGGETGAHGEIRAQEEALAPLRGQRPPGEGDVDRGLRGRRRRHPGLPDRARRGPGLLPGPVVQGGGVPLRKQEVVLHMDGPGEGPGMEAPDLGHDQLERPDRQGQRHPVEDSLPPDRDPRQERGHPRYVGLPSPIHPQRGQLLGQLAR